VRSQPKMHRDYPDRYLDAVSASSADNASAVGNTDQEQLRGRRIRSGAAVRKNAELVPLWVGKYDPTLIACLADVGVSST
jgi:hypothetical protein